MAKTEAVSIFKANRTDEDELREVYANIVDQIQVNTLSTVLKNTNLSGDPEAGSVVVRRLQTSLVKDQGTARTAGEGDKISDNGVTVNLDVRKEIVEEVNRMDIRQYGIPELVRRREQNFVLATARHLDTAFFTEAESAGTEATVVATDIADQVEELIQSVETVKNENVDGVNRELINLTLSPAAYGMLRNKIHTYANPNEGGVDINTFNGVRVWSNLRQTEDAIAMVQGSIALPVVIEDFDLEKINLSAESGLTMFFNYGVKAVMADLIKYANLLGS